MYFFSFILGVVLFLMLVYYVMLALHMWDILTFTNRKIKANRAWIPFYYWIY